MTPLHFAAFNGTTAIVTVLLDHKANIDQPNSNGWSPLLCAAYKGRDETMALLLDRGADINKANNDSITPLYHAAEQGHESAVALLVARGADVNQADNDGDKPLDVTKLQTIKDILIPLTTEQQEAGDEQSGQALPKVVNAPQWFRAAKKGDLAVIQQGIIDKIDVNCRDSKNRTALYHASQQGHVLLVEYLISQHADLSITSTDTGMSPLHMAAWTGHDAVIAVLLSHGADVNHVTNDGLTPLHCAAYSDQEAVVTILLSHGADVNRVNKYGDKPIGMAKTEQIKDILLAHATKITEEKEKNEQQPDQAVLKMVDESQWLQAAAKGDLAVIQQGINDKIDINCQDSGGRTAVYWAAQEGHLFLLEYLISQHADLSIPTNPGWLTHHIAAFNGHDAVVAALISKISDINSPGADGWTALHCAAYKGQLAALNILLANGGNINQANNDGRSPLHEAVDKSHDAVVAVLLSHGADVNQTDIDGDKPIVIAKTQTIKDMLIPLTTEQQDDQQQAVPKIVDEAQWFRAAKKGNLALIQRGINDKIDINCRDSGGRTAVYHGASEGHILVVQYLISLHSDLSIASTITGNSPLHMAAFKRHDAVVALLLSHGADVSQANKDGSSPLHIAVYEGCDAVVAVLLINGADINQANKDGKKPIDWAKNQKTKDILLAHMKKKQQEEGEGEQLPAQAVPKMVNELQWFQAAMKGDLAVIQQGINDKIDVNCRDSRGRHAVYWAAQEGHVSLLEYLITLHSDLNIATTDGGLTALSIASSNGNIAIMTVLLSHGADVNHTNFNQWSPLHFSAYNGHDTAAVLLLSNGADVNQVNNDGWTALHEAAHGGKDAVVAVLIDKGADVNKTDIDGDKPIDIARNQSIKDMLIPLTTKQQDDQQQAVPKIVDEAMWFRAAKKGKLALIQQGIIDKIDVNCQNTRFRTAVYIAAQEGHIELLKYLISQHADLSISTVIACWKCFLVILYSNFISKFPNYN